MAITGCGGGADQLVQALKAERGRGVGLRAGRPHGTNAEVVHRGAGQGCQMRGLVDGGTEEGARGQPRAGRAGVLVARPEVHASPHCCGQLDPIVDDQLRASREAEFLQRRGLAGQLRGRQGALFAELQHLGAPIEQTLGQLDDAETRLQGGVGQDVEATERRRGRGGHPIMMRPSPGHGKVAPRDGAPGRPPELTSLASSRLLAT